MDHWQTPGVCLRVFIACKFTKHYILTYLLTYLITHLLVNMRELEKLGGFRDDC